MKKILAGLFLGLFIINTTFAYSPTTKDTKIVENLTSKINNVINKKGEKVRPLFVKKLTKLQLRVKKDARLTYIIEEVINNLNNSTIDIEKIIDDIEKENIVYEDVKQSNNYSEFLIFERYMEIYNKYITDYSYWLDKELTIDCGTYIVNWNDYKKNEFQEIYNTAVDFNSKFITELIISDINNFSKYYNKACWSSSSLKWLTKKDVAKNYNDSLFFVYFKTWFVNEFNYSNRLFEEEKESITFCNSKINDWNSFKSNRISFLKTYFSANWKYYNDIISIDSKYKKLFKKECNWISLK